MHKRFLYIIILVLPLVMTAQTSNEESSIGGVKWTTGLSWEQIKQRAKQENKYIFLDIFTTWCGPCKMMDRNVYTNDTVGDYFNRKFISVKVQMDQTKKDNGEVKAWYSTAVEFAKQYYIEGFPTLIFLSPQAEVIGKELGGRGPKELIAIAQLTIQSGKKLEDKYAEYGRLVADYKAGKKNYDKMPYMIQVAYKFGDDELGNKLLKEHTEYVSKLPEYKRYTKENIEFWSGVILDRNGFIFRFFNTDKRAIDKTMNQPGYANSIIDKTIQKTIVDSFFRMQGGETVLINGKTVKNSEVMLLGQQPVRTDGQINTDKVEANWKNLHRVLRKEFSKQTAQRNVLLARISWYKQHQNKVEEVRYTLRLYSKDPPDHKTMNVAEINELVWNVFLYVPNSEKGIIKSSLKWAKKALDAEPIYLGMIDTYANLLYKAGDTNEAIHWEEKAVTIAGRLNAERAANGQLLLRPNNSPEYFQSVVEQMKRGEKTYTKEGATWN